MIILSITNNQRPGVYSQYEITSFYSTPRSRKSAAVVARATGGAPLIPYTFSGYGAACQVFEADAENAAMLGLIRLLFRAGVSEVVAVAVNDSYADALALIESTPDIGAVVCDCTETGDIRALRDSVRASAAGLLERIAFCGVEDAEEALAAAGACNSERVVLCCPAVSADGTTRPRAVYAAAALAGAVLAGGDPTYNYNGEAFPLLCEPERLEESVIQRLLAGGVCVFEPCGGQVECIRAITTRSTTAGAADVTLRPLNTVLIIDDVMQTMRAALKKMLRGAHLSGGSVQSVRSQAAVELAAKLDEGVITAYEPPLVYSDSTDPSVCVVELSFSAAHVLSQIHITAHIRA